MYMSDQAGILQKWLSNQGIILAASSPIYFLNYAYFNIKPSLDNYGTPYKYMYCIFYLKRNMMVEY